MFLIFHIQIPALLDLSIFLVPFPSEALRPLCLYLPTITATPGFEALFHLAEELEKNTGAVKVLSFWGHVWTI